jgi:hypothetical protein
VFLANAAQADQTGLVSVLGAFIDTVQGPQLPVRQQLWVVGRLTLEPEDTTLPHPLAIIVEHSDGTEQVARIEIVLPSAPPGSLDQFDADLPLGFPLALLLPLEFRRVGIYEVRLVLDGDPIWTQALRVKTIIPQM